MSRLVNFRRLKSLLLGLLAFVVASIGTVAVAELALRLLPIPGVTYNTFYYDEVTGERFYPGTRKIYRNERGDHVTRHVNAYGYLDREFPAHKAPGTERIGFFGDSFTEARQVPLQRTFHRQIEEQLNAAGAGPVDVVAIGMMGYGTLQSFLEYERWADSLQIDMAVYVFCENDPGNNLPEVNRYDTVPYPLLRGDSLIVDTSFRDRYAYKTSRLHRIWQYLKSHSLLVSVLEVRLKLLKAHGVRLRVSEAERRMAGRAQRGTMPDAIAVPSSWPDSLVTEAERVTAAVIREWHTAAERDGKQFAVLYIPREPDLAIPAAEQDSWAGWLFELCRREHIPLIDPSQALLAQQRLGREIYYDHLSAAGHDAVAASFVDWYRKQAPAPAPR